jgi:hypothetical protein
VKYENYLELTPLFVIFYRSKDKMLSTLCEHEFFVSYTKTYMCELMGMDEILGYCDVIQKIRTLLDRLMAEKFVRYADIVSVTYNYNAHDILFGRGCKKLYCTIDIPSWFEWDNNVSIEDIEFHLCGFHGSRYYERIYGGKIKGYKDNGWIFWESDNDIWHKFFVNVNGCKYRHAKVLLDKEIIICGCEYKEKDFVERLNFLLDSYL